MDIPEKDRKIIRDLAKRRVEIAKDPIQQEKTELWRRLNNLERVKPMVLIDDATGHETGDKITLECESDIGRSWEGGFKHGLYQWDHMRDDTIYTATMGAPLYVESTGMGLHQDTTNPDHVFGARQYNTTIEDGADPNIIPMPEVTVDWERSRRGHEDLCDLFGDIFDIPEPGPGAVGGYWFAIIDSFITWRGLEKTFIDMVDNPEWLHSWLRRMTDYHLVQLDKYEAMNLLSLNNGICRVGPGGYSTTDRLPQPDFDGVHVRTKDQWSFATTQIFSEVSPAMHEEFALRYEGEFLSRFGLASYGCCEPLDRKVGILKKHIPNLHRMSMSPWVDVARGAEALGNTAVFSYKPNPAILGGEVWDVDYARDQLRDVFEKTKDCCIEVIMKDLHSVRGDVTRMWEWTEMAMDLAQEYA